MRLPALAVVLLLTCAVIDTHGWVVSPKTPKADLDNAADKPRKLIAKKLGRTIKRAKPKPSTTIPSTNDIQGALAHNLDNSTIAETFDNSTIVEPELPFIGTEDLCIRVHNNTAFEGAEPYETILTKNAYACQKACVGSFPKCVAVMFYYLANQTDGHICYQFDHNSLDPDVQLIPEAPKNEKDVIRALEIVYDCHQFDAFPPLGEDGVVTSSDKVPRSKRESGQYLDIETQGPWSNWGSCTPSGVQARSQACEYGRKIQRRGCPARDFARQQQRLWPAQPQYYPPQPYNHNDQRAVLERQRAEHDREYQRRLDEYHRLVDERRRLDAQRNPVAPTVVSPQYVYPQVQDAGAAQLHPAIPPELAVQCGNTVNCQPRRALPPPSCRSVSCVPPPLPLGTWLPWSAWSPCSHTCDDGIQQRRRLCSTGDCGPGADVESQPCNLGPCPTWSEWCDWSTCSVTCGKGQKSRERWCLRGTDRCEGNSFESLECDSGPCPEWTPWTDWGLCSSSCGYGTQSRQRTCLNANGTAQCLGSKFENRACDSGPCPEWSRWSDWTQCSTTCDYGTQSRQRTCLNGGFGAFQCLGESLENRACNPGPCPEWTPWADWSQCSVTCGYGAQSRERTCLNEGYGAFQCIGQKIENRECDSGPCPEWSPWGDWGQCSTTCDYGIQSRLRTCLNGGFGAFQCRGESLENRACNPGPCSYWGPWQEWSACSVSCDDGTRTRSRVCEGGNDCVGVSIEEISCFGPPCVAWTPWAEWSRCSVTCGPGQKTRERTCQASDGLPLEGCVGDKLEIALCTEVPCPTWSAWSAWSACDRDCGGGISIRSRACSGSPYGNNSACLGPHRETKRCNEHACAPKCQWTEWCSWSECSAYTECEAGVSQRSRQCVGEAGCSCQGYIEESRPCRGTLPCAPPPPPCTVTAPCTQPCTATAPCTQPCSPNIPCTQPCQTAPQQPCWYY